MTDILVTEKCTGCRSCELACSYHHRQVFMPCIASIHVQQRNAGGLYDIRLVKYEQAQDGHLACDCAKGKEFCVNYCPLVARDELKALLQLKSE